jgi:hypothetical protein
MLFKILIQAIISFIVIYVGHSIYIFLRDNFTTPIVKDLVHNPKQRYKEMYDIVHKNNDETNEQTKEDMKNELKSFLKNSKNNNIENNDHNDHNDNIKKTDNVNDIGYTSFNLSNNDNLQYSSL